MKIGELAQAARTTTETVRYYEKQGLLPPAERGLNNYRSYAQTHLARLRLIRNCRALDMTHEEIRAILNLIDRSAASCEPINHVFDEHIAHVDTRIAELQRLKSQLTELRRCCEGQASAECGILQGLFAMRSDDANAVRQTHLS